MLERIRRPPPPPEPVRVDCVFIVVAGFAPELYHGYALRRAKRSPPSELKSVMCPHCEKGVLARIEPSAKVDVYRHPAHKKMICQQYVKCRICGKETGVVLTPTALITE